MMSQTPAEFLLSVADIILEGKDIDCYERSATNNIDWDVVIPRAVLSVKLKRAPKII